MIVLYCILKRGWGKIFNKTKIITLSWREICHCLRIKLLRRHDTEICCRHKSLKSCEKHNLMPKVMSQWHQIPTDYKIIIISSLWADLDISNILIDLSSKPIRHFASISHAAIHITLTTLLN